MQTVQASSSPLPFDEVAIEKPSTGSTPGAERHNKAAETGSTQVKLVLNEGGGDAEGPAVVKPGEGLPLQQAGIEKRSTGSKPGKEESAHLEEVNRGSPQVAMIIDSNEGKDTKEPSPVVVKPREEGIEASPSLPLEEASIDKPSTGSKPGHEASASLDEVDRSEPQVALVLSSNDASTSTSSPVVVKPGEEKEAPLAETDALEEAAIEKPSTGSKPGVGKPAAVEKVDRSKPKVALVVESDDKKNGSDAVVVKPGEEVRKTIKAKHFGEGMQKNTEKASKAGA
eukprot:CAMPEP_0194749588 /NCGR_PEP_ID=MMETSP0323_2-20130528/3736_1 /TAXON_ID=2866 ORGANISM="Crypthecodinium cohnii, Strain Seligo" /NCGR_SAMPLE_ID=MMETSP0323_2 /ASSEMBLY_ACC=CAM_ASM_000346 /LENGTH=283 /DNA_ID=CAMNT_0039664755 /DNA_START=38 /DNA_END=889 /DNA_ORIENTATION=-